jgi:hypothetical protein
MGKEGLQGQLTAAAAGLMSKTRMQMRFSVMFGKWQPGSFHSFLAATLSFLWPHMIN